MVKSRRLNIRVTETLARQLEHEARQHGVTMMAIIEAAIQRYCDDEVSEPPEALILRRLDRIDRSQANAERRTRHGGSHRNAEALHSLLANGDAADPRRQS